MAPGSAPRGTRPRPTGTRLLPHGYRLCPIGTGPSPMGTRLHPIGSRFRPMGSSCQSPQGAMEKSQGTEDRGRRDAADSGFRPSCLLNMDRVSCCHSKPPSGGLGYWTLVLQSPTAAALASPALLDHMPPVRPPLRAPRRSPPTSKARPVPCGWLPRVSDPEGGGRSWGEALGGEVGAQGARGPEGRS